MEARRRRASDFALCPLTTGSITYTWIHHRSESYFRALPTLDHRNAQNLEGTSLELLGLGLVRGQL